MGWELMFWDALLCMQCHFQILAIFVLYCSAGRGHTPVQKRKHDSHSMNSDSTSSRGDVVLPGLHRHSMLTDPNDAHRYAVTSVLLISGVFFINNLFNLVIT